MSPHRVRHSSITAALEATGGDVRRVQKLSRHSSLNTLMLYDDARKNHQREVTDLLVGLRRFRSAKKAQTITGQRVNLDL